MSIFHGGTSTYFCRMRPLFFFTFIFSLNYSTDVVSQKLTPTIQNNGGGFVNRMEWSIGESASIDFFTTNKVLLNTGVLQPMSNVVTEVIEYGPAVFGHQITIGPNPTTAYIHFNALFSSIGNLKIQVIDARSQLIESIDAGTIFSTYDKIIHLEQFPAGAYFVKVYFQPVQSNYAPLKSGIYKIIKL